MLAFKVVYNDGERLLSIQHRYIPPEYVQQYGIGKVTRPVLGTYLFVFKDLKAARLHALCHLGEVYSCEAEIADVLVVRCGTEDVVRFWEKYNSPDRYIVQDIPYDDAILRAYPRDNDPVDCFAMDNHVSISTAFAKSVTLLELIAD